MAVQTYETTIPDDDVQRRAAVEQLARRALESVGDARPLPNDVALDVTVLSGGITNQLYRARRTDTNVSVVVRVFGKQTDLLISRDAEFFWQGLFLRTLGRCPNGLVYEFLDGYETLDGPMCSAYAEGIADCLADLHLEAAARAALRLPYATQKPFADVVLEDWVDLGTSAPTLARIEERGKAVALRGYGSLESFRKDASELLREIRRVAHLVPLVPCHNDLLPMNILRRPTDGHIRLIDFEYMRRNYFLADIANHFCEHAGFECEWDKLPSLELQRDFLATYFAKALPDAAAEERGACVDRALGLMPLFMLYSDFLWGSWSLVQGANSVIDFDYVSYGARRYSRFKAEKERAMAAARHAVPLHHNSD